MSVLNPIRHLAGKLNHFHIPQTRCMRIIVTANSLPEGNDATPLPSVDEILSLKHDSQQINPRVYHKFQLENQVHTHASTFNLPSTIFDDLNPH